MTTYEVRILDANGGVTAVLDDTELASLRYERKLNEVGACQFSIVADQLSLPAQPVTFAKDTFVEIARFPDPDIEQHEGTYLVRLLELYEDEQGTRWLIVGGFSLEVLLLGRIVDPRNDPSMAGGWSIKNGAADDVIEELVTEQAGSGADAYQQIPYLTVSPSGGVGLPWGGRLAWDGLLDTLQVIARAGRVDFTLTRGGGLALSFTAAPVGVDRSKSGNYLTGPFVLFSPELGNMARPRLTRDWRKEKTYCYLLGPADGSEDQTRQVYEQTSGALSDTPYSYAAVVADARRVEEGDEIEFLSQAREVLNKHRAKTAFVFELTNIEAEYRRRWDIGDRVTVAWLDYEDDMRLVGVEVQMSGNEEMVRPLLEETW